MCGDGVYENTNIKRMEKRFEVKNGSSNGSTLKKTKAHNKKYIKYCSSCLRELKKKIERKTNTHQKISSSKCQIII